ncbi:ATP-dependent DNA helicase DinG [Sansalvadorimonas sp. 2012CJ34-2]|uniref:ATP-dependent DNA helicase DinG n=1 Tax=Parendozoicomonas callyspongiae TaxID=2942213 RepID=A0ABT0PKX6_9GAMM|nr:ATP-dependent DNA helicase DinG [Sansalvadorimonas sp. 2012CJ34-2]MCL6272025.1 ATP-dependent DNA helicase DinG [Sansalvadorimonas sp. 2012CJ34-2]
MSQVAPALRQTIQKAYSQFLQKRELKPRYGQKVMIAEIAKTIGTIDMDDDGKRTSDPAVCVIEAGTGTGKTVGYTLAGIPLAKDSEKTLVISTATVALQEQILNKDLPDIRHNSGLDFTVALAKGRRRYICVQKLDTLLQSQNASAATMALFAEEGFKIDLDESATLLYENMITRLASGSWDGDRDSWADSIEDDEWFQLTSTHAQCTGPRCPHFSGCPFYRARASLDKVDVIITNHDLVLSDLMLGGGAILPAPKECLYVFDEGHHLPDKAISHFSHETRLNDTARWLEQSGKQLGRILGSHALPGKIGEWFEQLEGRFRELKEEQTSMREALLSIADFNSSSESENGRTLVYRLPNGVVPDELMEMAGRMKAGFSVAVDLADRVVGELKSALDGDVSGVDRLQAEQILPVIGSLLLRLQSNHELWMSWSKPDPESVPPSARWIELADNNGYQDLKVASSLILAGGLLREYLWNHAWGAVVTSATLTALGHFDRYRMRAGIPVEARCEVVPSPFHHADAGVLKIPQMKTDPGQADKHTDELIDSLPGMFSKTAGTLVLFSSRRQMKDVFFGLDRDERKLVMMQDDYSKKELLRLHREKIDEGDVSVIFGLASLAEGIDLPGKYCEHVVIAKIPFAVPDDPVEASLAEWVEARGGNPFMEISVPDAAIRLVQASGRLLRTEQDKGLITILDRRLLTRRYGQALLDSLPPYQRQIS